MSEFDGKPDQGPSHSEIPLIVSFERGLCRTDVRAEMVAQEATRDPSNAIPLLLRTLKGGPSLREWRRALPPLDPEALPLSAAVVEKIRAARLAGRRVYLLSDAPASQLQGFLGPEAYADEVITLADQPSDGTAPEAARAAILAERFGNRAYDYVGGSEMDLPTWQSARIAITVDAPEALRKRVDALGLRVEHLAPKEGGLAAVAPWLRALRPHQWAKNLLVFLPMLTAHLPGALWPSIVAFVAFSLTASSVYLINDLADLRSDRRHPRKRLRPFAAGEISLAKGAQLAVALLGAAIALSLAALPLPFMGVLLGYFAATLAYSFWLKRKLILDVLTLAGLYTMRILAGAAATGIPLSPWMLGFSMFLFLSLAAVKRQAELTDQLKEGRESAGRAYEIEDLPILRSMALSAAYAAILVFALYINSETVVQLYRSPELLWLICPLLLYWTTRAVMKAHRGLMTDDPIVFAATDHVSRATILCAMIVFVLASAI